MMDIRFTSYQVLFTICAQDFACYQVILINNRRMYDLKFTI